MFTSSASVKTVFPSLNSSMYDYSASTIESAFRDWVCLIVHLVSQLLWTYYRERYSMLCGNILRYNITSSELSNTIRVLQGVGWTLLSNVNVEALCNSNYKASLQKKHTFESSFSFSVLDLGFFWTSVEESLEGSAWAFLFSALETSILLLETLQSACHVLYQSQQSRSHH